MKPEEWRPVAGKETHEVSSLGRVRSWIRPGSRDQIALTPRILKPFANRKGYMHINLSREDRRLVHRVVLEAFVGMCPEGHEACHGDGDPGNNELSNLRWDSRSANQMDKLKHSTLPRGGDHANAILNETTVREIRRLYSIDDRPTQRQLANRYGVEQTTISAVIRGKIWGHLQ